MSVKQLLTAEELWDMPEVPGMRYELVEGELVEAPAAGARQALIAASMFRLIHAYSKEHQLGLAFTDGVEYILKRHPDCVRLPDASFISSACIPESGIPEGFWELAPDLAVEVVSPSDRADDVRRKVRDYLEAGTRLVWLVWPRERSVTVYAAGGDIRELGEGDELHGGEVLPGFQVRVAELFDVHP